MRRGTNSRHCFCSSPLRGHGSAADWHERCTGARLSVQTAVIPSWWSKQVVVKDKKGDFIGGLTARNFTVAEDGAPQTIKFFEQQNFEGCRAVTPKPRIDEDITIYKKLSRTQFAPESSGRKKYNDRRLLALYFDMTAMQPADQMRALDRSGAFCAHTDDASGPGFDFAVSPADLLTCCRTSRPTATAC